MLWTCPLTVPGLTILIVSGAEGWTHGSRRVVTRVGWDRMKKALDGRARSARSAKAVVVNIVKSVVEKRVGMQSPSTADQRYIYMSP